MTQDQEQKVEALANRATELGPKESDFIEKLYDFTYGELSEDQECWLNDIHKRFFN